MERYGGAGKSGGCRGTVSTLFCAPIHCRRPGSLTSGEVERLDKGLLIRRAGCGESCKSGSVGEAAGDRHLYPTASHPRLAAQVVGQRGLAPTLVTATPP